jgi:Protein of unknown function (DUF4241)
MLSGRHLQEYLQRLSADAVSFVYRGQPGRTERIEAGVLELPTGKLSIRDPYGGYKSDWDSDMVFAKVPPGTYPVWVTSADLVGGTMARGAAVTVLFGDEYPASWRAAVGEEDAPGAFGVDASQGCLLDASNLGELERFQQAERDGEPGFFDIISETRDVLVRYPDQDQFRILVFDCGSGDGAYPVYAGHDANGRLLRLIVDLDLRWAGLEWET